MRERAGQTAWALAAAFFCCLSARALAGDDNFRSRGSDQGRWPSGPVATVDRSRLSCGLPADSWGGEKS